MFGATCISIASARRPSGEPRSNVGAEHARLRGVRRPYVSKPAMFNEGPVAAVQAGTSPVARECDALNAASPNAARHRALGGTAASIVIRGSGISTRTTSFESKKPSGKPNASSIARASPLLAVSEDPPAAWYNESRSISLGRTILLQIIFAHKSGGTIVKLTLIGLSTTGRVRGSRAGCIRAVNSGSWSVIPKKNFGPVIAAFSDTGDVP